MKNALSITVGLLFTLLSCDSRVTISQSEYDKLKGVKVEVKRTITFPESSSADYYRWKIIKGSDGHDYLENDRGNSYVLMHYVECSKCKKK